MLSFFCAAVITLRPASAADALDQAVEAYDHGRFEEASQDFERALEQGYVNGHVLFDLGNAYFKSGEKGEALAAYLAARRLLPRDPDVKANLEYVARELKVPLEAGADAAALPSSLARWTSALTTTELFAIAAALLALALGASGLTIGLGYKGKSPHVAAGIFSIAALALGFCWQERLTERPWGAVARARASVQSGPGDKGHVVVFELTEGYPVLIKNEVNGWLMIELADGKQGWLKSDYVRYFALDTAKKPT